MIEFIFIFSGVVMEGCSRMTGCVRKTTRLIPGRRRWHDHDRI